MDFCESITFELPQVQDRLVEFSEGDAHKGLVVELAAIHEGLTANYNHYSRTELEKALNSWVEPYPKPIIRNHDIMDEPMGRVMAARMDQEADGSPYTRLQIAVLDPAAMEKVLDQRYITGSVGGKAGEALCSVCGKDWANASMFDLPCRHERGKVYKGKLAYFEMKNIAFKEYSFVNAPADQRSSIRSIGGAEDDGGGDEAADDNNNGWVRAQLYVVDMNKESVIELNESGDRNMLAGKRRKEASPFYHILRGAFLSTLAISEETNSMEQDDILEVAEGLTQDTITDPVLQGEDAASEEEAPEVEDATGDEAEPEKEEDKDEVEAADESAEDKTDDAAAEEDKEENEEAPAEEEEVAEEGDTPEGQEKPHDDDTKLPKDREGSDEEIVTESEETDAVETGTDVTEGDERDAELTRISEENTRLRTALKRMLAERVVDTKITLGLEEKDQRSKLVNEHVTRTASSLADSLQDLANVQTISRVNSTEGLTIESTVASVDNDNDRIDPVESVEQPTEADPETSFVDTMVDALMGRRKIS